MAALLSKQSRYYIKVFHYTQL